LLEVISSLNIYAHYKANKGYNSMLGYNSNICSESPHMPSAIQELIQKQ